MAESEASVETALGHLRMMALAAQGEYSPRKGELERREAALISFIRSGQCLATDDDRELLTKIRMAMTTQAA